MNTRQAGRLRRHHSIRKRLFGAPDRPRMSVFRSHKYLYVQLIDDLKNETVLSCSTQMAGVREALTKSTGSMAAAERLGHFVAAEAKKRGIARVVFDRAGYRYHGSIKVLADAARSGGLAF